jgi:hypothetical protein
MLSAEQFGRLLFAQYNFKGISCTDFHTCLQIQSTEMYEWAYK